MNNSKNSSTNQTPFYLNYGRHPKSPLALGVEIRKPMKGYDNLNAHGLAVAIEQSSAAQIGAEWQTTRGECASSDMV